MQHWFGVGYGVFLHQGYTVEILEYSTKMLSIMLPSDNVIEESGEASYLKPSAVDGVDRYI